MVVVDVFAVNLLAYIITQLIHPSRLSNNTF